MPGPREGFSTSPAPVGQNLNPETAEEEQKVTKVTKVTFRKLFFRKGKSDENRQKPPKISPWAKITAYNPAY